MLTAAKSSAYHAHCPKRRQFLSDKRQKRHVQYKSTGRDYEESVWDSSSMRISVAVGVQEAETFWN